MTALELLALLVFAHVLADYPMQGAFIAMGKNRTKPLPGTPWYQLLSAHAVMHGGMIGIVVVAAGLAGHPELFNVALPVALAETACHWLIDDWKCRSVAKSCEPLADGETDRRCIRSYDIDQSLHLACKVCWTAACVCIAGLPLVAR